MKMNKLLKIAIILFFLGTYLSFSQYTEIINSNRPGNSSGAFSVGQDILQLENGFYYSNEKHDLLNYTAKGYGFNFNIRYGFLTEKLEIVLNGVFHADKLKDHRYTPSNNYNRKNFKDFKLIPNLNLLTNLNSFQQGTHEWLGLVSYYFMGRTDKIF